MRNLLKSTLFLLLIAASLIPADDGRDFVGYFNITDPTDLGDEVIVTLTVRILNFSGQDVIDTTVTLEDFFPPAEIHGTFPGFISVPNGTETSFEGEFTIPKVNFEQWQRGANPALRLDFKDPVGEPARKLVGLIRVAEED